MKQQKGQRMLTVCAPLTDYEEAFKRLDAAIAERIAMYTGNIKIVHVEDKIFPRTEEQQPVIARIMIYEQL